MKTSTIVVNTLTIVVKSRLSDAKTSTIVVKSRLGDVKTSTIDEKSRLSDVKTPTIDVESSRIDNGRAKDAMIFARPFIYFIPIHINNRTDDL